MFDLIKRYRLLLSIIFVIISTLIFIFQTGKKQENSIIQNISQTVTYPIQSVFYTIITTTKNITQSYFYLVELQKENETLKQQIFALKEEVNRYIEESIQYNRLKVQLEFAESNPDKKIFAEVIGESVDNIYQTLQLNRGSSDGIKRNFPVILQEGVVGRIQSSTLFQSTVQLILDHRSRLPAIIQRTRAKGLVYGTRNGLELRRIQLRVNVQIGDRVVASGLSGLYPKGALIGVVTSVEREEYELFQTAQLKSAINFEKIEGAFVILKSKSQAQLPLFSESEVPSK